MIPPGRPSWGAWIAAAFLVAGLLTLDDYGWTWDEDESLEAGLRNVEIVSAVTRGTEVPDWAFHELPGYTFVIDLLRGALVRMVAHGAGWLEEVRAFHLSHLLLSTASLWLFWLTVRRIGAGERVAALSTLALAMLPQFVAHSQNNPKDLPGLFVVALSGLALVSLTRTSSWRAAAGAGAALGLAFSTAVTAALVVPIVATWRWLARKPIAWSTAAIVAVTATIVAFVTWPWLWPDPSDRLIQATSHLSSFNKPWLQVLYFGRVYHATDVPWHYTTVMVFVTTPIWYVAAAGLAAYGLAGRRRWLTPEARDAAGLGALWIGLPLVAELFASVSYDGVRHLLFALPGLCLLVGVGLDAVMRAIAGDATTAVRPHLRTTGASLLAAALFASTAWGLTRTHPYHNAYLNAVTTSLLPGNADEVFELEYWCQAYDEGAEWLDAHADPAAAVYVAFVPSCADRELDRAAHRFDDGFFDRSRPAYFMVMTRRAFFTDRIQRILREYEPVHVIRRGPAVLLLIYSNDRRAIRRPSG